MEIISVRLLLLIPAGRSRAMHYMCQLLVHNRCLSYIQQPTHSKEIKIHIRPFSLLFLERIPIRIVTNQTTFPATKNAKTGRTVKAQPISSPASGKYLLFPGGGQNLDARQRKMSIPRRFAKVQAFAVRESNMLVYSTAINVPLQK